MLNTNQVSYLQKWKSAWQSLDFRKKMWGGIIALVILFSFFPWFFQAIERRQGILLNDWVLNVLPVFDASIPIFILIWLATLLIVVRFFQDPEIFLCFLWCYILLCISRIITISLVPLDPPRGLVPLTDRLANAFYGPKFITRDLFYSGHTASVFLIYLCLKRKADKIFALLATLVVGVLLIIQHVHYTIDVLAAPLFAYAMYLLGTKIAGNGSLQAKKSQKASPN